MAVYKRNIVDIELEQGNIHRSWLQHSIGMKDQKADHFGVRVFRNGEPVSLTGVSVQGVFMPPEGSPIAITSGNIVSGNVAEVVLPQACYNYDGQFTLAIKLVDSSNGVTDTVRIVDGMVDNTHASGTVAPTSAVPTYQEVLSAYEQAITVINKSVRFDTTQSLTDTQKTTARGNIDAASTGAVSELKSALYGLNDGIVPISANGDYYSYKFGNYNIGDTISLTPEASTTKYSIVTITNLKKNNEFVLTARGGTTALPWAFLTTAGKLLDKSGDASVTDEVLTAPADGCILIVQTSDPTTASLYSAQCYSTIENEFAVVNENVSCIRDVNLRVISTSGEWEQGRFSDANIGNTVTDQASTMRIRTGYINISVYDSLAVSVTYPYSFLCYLFDKDKKITAKINSWTGTKTVIATNNARFVRFILQNNNNTIVPSEATNISVSEAEYKIYKNTKAVDAIKDYVPIQFDLSKYWEQGRFTAASPGSTVSDIDSATRIRTSYVDVADWNELFVEAASGYSYY